MKKILSIYSLLSLFAVIMLASCEDEDLIRYPNIEKSIAMRLQLDPNFSLFDALDVPNAKLVFSLFTEGDNVQDVNLYVDYYNFAQDSVYDRVFVQGWTANDFTDGVIADFDLPSTQVANSLGIDVNTIAGGDRMDFKIFIRDTNGQLFPDSVPTVPGTTNTNMTPGDLNSTTASITTQFTVFVACPVDPAYAVGVYKFEQLSGTQDPFFGTGNVLATIDEVTISAPDLLTRTFTPVSYATFVGGKFDMLLVCNSIVIPYTPAPASCGGGLGWTIDPGNIPAYDDADDSVFEISFFHNPTGDCGLAVNDPVTVRLTKL